QGLIKAQEALGELYETGHSGAPIDIAESAKWYRRAVEKGDATSATQLANLVFQGKGIPKNVPEAIQLWTFAAEHGNNSAQRNLAQMYLTGTGVPRDLSKARALLELANAKTDVSRQLNASAPETARQEVVAAESQPPND